MVAGYIPRHDTQFEPRTRMSGLNCNMAAAADVGRFYSLGKIDHNHQWYRDRAQNPDGSQDKSGGTHIYQAAEVLDDAGIPSTVYDSDDRRTIISVRKELTAGNVIIAHGDNGSLPRGERGEISPSFTGLHSVDAVKYSASKGYLIGDGLSQDYNWWSEPVMNAYMRDFPGGGFTYLVVKPRRIKAKADYASVRREPNRQHAPIGRITGRSRTHYGSIVVGEAVGRNRNWYRVWWNGRIAYVHSSVTVQV